MSFPHYDMVKPLKYGEFINTFNILFNIYYKKSAFLVYITELLRLFPLKCGKLVEDVQNLDLTAFPKNL